MSNLTEEQKANNVAALRAEYDGKPWQTWIDGREWKETPKTTVAQRLVLGYPCRPTPEPAPPKPWSCPDDVPGPVCWIRVFNGNGASDMDAKDLQIYEVNSTGVFTNRSGGVVWDWIYLANTKAQYSTTRAKGSWKPCHKQP